MHAGAAWEGHQLDYYTFNGGHMIDTAGETKVFESAVRFVSNAFKKEPIKTKRWSHYDLSPNLPFMTILFNPIKRCRIYIPEKC